jgi:hypothetical protein
MYFFMGVLDVYFSSYEIKPIMRGVYYLEVIVLLSKVLIRIFLFSD